MTSGPPLMPPAMAASVITKDVFSNGRVFETSPGSSPVGASM